ncbi:hypothetical protein ACN47E_007312 [Coniothyrium glycines]
MIPDNPHNWTTATRAYHAIIPALFGFAVTFGTSIYRARRCGRDAVLQCPTDACHGGTLRVPYTFGLGVGARVYRAAE